MAVDYDSKKYLESVDAYWRAANYLSVGTLFLMGDPLLRQPLKAEDVKPKPIGHRDLNLRCRTCQGRTS